MGNAKPARRLSRATRTGLKDLPSNAAWLLSSSGTRCVAGEGASKAVSSVGESMSGTVSSAAGSAGAATSGVRRKARPSGSQLRKRCPASATIQSPR